MCRLSRQQLTVRVLARAKVRVQARVRVSVDHDDQRSVASGPAGEHPAQRGEPHPVHQHRARAAVVQHVPDLGLAAERIDRNTDRAGAHQ